MDLYTYILIWIAIIGLCLGSFYNVVILRTLSGESIVLPPSKCPNCNNKLKWWHNIPLLSYILLRGKCYFCKKKISIQYPIIEFTTMVLFVISYIKFGLEYKTLFVIFWLSCMLIMTMTDLKEKLVDVNLAIIIGISGLAYNYLENGFVGLKEASIALIGAIIILEAFARSGYLIAKTRAMGEGDTYVAAGVCAILGLTNSPLFLLYSLLASMLFIIPQFLYNQYKSNNKKTCILSVLFVLSILVFKTVSSGFIALLAVAITGLLLAFSIMSGIKTEENRTYVPFVPAFFIAFLYIIFSSF